MTQILNIYKCDICGNIVETVHAGDGELVCCGQPMKELEGHTTDEGKEKHVPVIEKVDGGFKVKIGSTPHPMEEKHYIEWVEIVHYPDVYRHFFKPGDAPEATFKIEGAGEVLAREYCNVHGLWQG